MSDLTVEFGNIIETPTVFPEEQGQLEITITNQSDEDVEGSTVNLYASTDTILDNVFFPTAEAFSDASPEQKSRTLNTNDDVISTPETIAEIDALQGSDEFLGDISGVNLSAGDTTTFTIDFASDDFRTASVVSPGAYNLIAEVDSDSDSNQENNQAVQFISSNNTDVILDWNSTFLNAVQAEGKADIAADIKLENDDDNIDAIPGVAPPIQARDGAILHTAIYDAVFALSDNPRSTGIAQLPDAPEDGSQEAAVVGAAYTVLSELFPEQQAVFAEQRDRSLAEISDDPTAEQAGFDFGVGVAEAILAERSEDRAAEAQVSYEPDAEPGNYQEYVESRRSPDNQVAALLPDWDRVTPFAINSPVDFQPNGQPDFTSDNFARDIEDVREQGGLASTNKTTIDRTPEETEIAQFWSYDRADTFRPPGQWNQIAQEVAIDEGNSLEDNALLFAELNIAMADAGIVTWDAKYDFGQLRPVTVINGVVDDNRDDTIVDEDWEPLIPTPNFPDYISGHSAFGGAAAGVLEDFFGNDVNFEIPTQELPGVSREFTSMGSMSSFEVAAEENAVSRLYGGVHVEISNVDGVDVGLDVANFVTDESDLFLQDRLLVLSSD